jgi:RHS repeat-associated protein
MYAVCEFGGHLNLEYKYIYANGMLLARYNESSADTHYYHHDGLGSIMGMTTGNASVEQSYFYDEFGNSLGSWGSVTNSYMYTGQEFDGSITGLYNLRARYYDKSIGRFVSEDPVWQNTVTFNKFCFFCKQFLSPQDFNAYPYVANNPINMTDPSGLWQFHGNWCGPNWSGGQEKPIENLKPKEIKKLLPPEDYWDWCCMEHDLCYMRCRIYKKNSSINFWGYVYCLEQCDEYFYRCWFIFPSLFM